MSDIDQDYYCNPPILDTTLFPVGTAGLDPNFNILPFLCQLIQVATNENIDPVLVPPIEYDMSKHLNFATLTGVGDPRWSTGAVLSAGFIKFLPMIITQLEVNQVGGSQIINNYICDADGNPIKQSLTAPILTTVGTGGVNLYGYDIPSGLDPNELLKTVTQEDVDNFVNQFIQDQSQTEADAFISYLQLNYPSSDWDASLHAFSNPSLFYVELSSKNNDQIVVLKYWDNVKEYVANQLYAVGYISSPTIQMDYGSIVKNNAVARAFILPIPTYSELLNDPNLTISHMTSADSLLSSTANENYVTLLAQAQQNSNISLSATRIALSSKKITSDAYNLTVFNF